MRRDRAAGGWVDDHPPPVQLHQQELARQTLLTHEVFINLIAATTTRTGLKVYARLDPNSYPKGIKITDQQLAAVNLQSDPFRPEWGHTITRTTSGNY
jgi:hypothetical protein